MADEKVIVLGEIYDKDSVPDFGSIRMSKPCTRREYILNSADVSKLNDIKNASDGSTAFCYDTGDLYLKTAEGWAKVGGESNG